MTQFSAGASGDAALGDPPWRPPSGLRHFISRKRVTISTLIYLLLIGGDLALGIRPHDVADWRDPWTVAGSLLVLVGLLLRSWAAGILRKNEKMTDIGPYRLMRHPLYVGSFLMMFGFCALIGSTKNIWFIAGPILWLYCLKIHDEEKSLAERFGEHWHDYSRRTPRFVPRSLRTSLVSEWAVQRWKISREYRAVGTTLLAFLALKIWRVL